MESVFISSDKISMILLLALDNFPFTFGMFDLPYCISGTSDASRRLLS